MSSPDFLIAPIKYITFQDFNISSFLGVASNGLIMYLVWL